MNDTRKRGRYNDTERAMWVENDENLYLMSRRWRGSDRSFVRAHRDTIDAVIRAAVGDQRHIIA